MTADVEQERHDHGEEVAWLAVVCTDRGTHKRTRLCSVRFYEDGHWTMSGPLESYAFLPPLEGSNSQYVFDCPRCPRTPMFGQDKWVAALAPGGRLSPAGWGESQVTADFDVSLVPF